MAALSASVRANKPLAAVMRAMHAIAPLHLADRSWDNVGLLLEAPKPRTSNGVFLAIDLTVDVATELLSERNQGVSVAVIYHPTIFRGLKSLTLSNTQQQSLLKCAAEGISIYCPHTSLDATPAGINDWLILNALSAANAAAGAKSQTRLTEETLSSARLKDAWGAQSPDTFLRALWASRSTANADAEAVKTLQPSDNVDSEQAGKEGWTLAGMGRQVTLPEPVSLGKFVQGFKREMGVEHGASHDAVVERADADLGSVPQRNWRTREERISIRPFGSSPYALAQAALSYEAPRQTSHELLGTTEPGSTSILLLRHSASERGFLQDILKPRLQALLMAQQVSGDSTAGAGVAAEWDVVVSEQDRDPLEYV
ncbi:hypothetical protein OC835_004814 [Tilletia horrida]|nr:hypothetical protein OC835_004814 [Tilletia horrida]